MEKTLSVKKLREHGIDVDKYFANTYNRAISIDKIKKDRDKILAILKEHYPWLLVLRGYDPFRNPLYSLNLFCTYLDSFFSTRQPYGSPEYRKQLLSEFSFQGTHQVPAKWMNKIIGPEVSVL